jgi:hypothetical protein
VRYILFEDNKISCGSPIDSSSSSFSSTLFFLREWYPPPPPPLPSSSPHLSFVARVDGRWGYDDDHEERGGGEGGEYEEGEWEKGEMNKMEIEKNLIHPSPSPSPPLQWSDNRNALIFFVDNLVAIVEKNIFFVDLISKDENVFFDEKILVVEWNIVSKYEENEVNI